MRKFYEFEKYLVDNHPYYILFYCLSEMGYWILSEGMDYALNRLFNEGQIANNDDFGWELARWSEHYLSWDKDGCEITATTISHIDDNAYFAWLDPYFFGAEDYWAVYTEQEVKWAIHVFSEYWLDKFPNRAGEYAQVLQKYGITPRNYQIIVNPSISIWRRFFAWIFNS